MNSKQRSYLRALATKIQPLVTIGKQGLSENVVAEINEVLEAKELVKISVLKNALREPKEILEEAAIALKAEAIASIGYKIVIYRRSKKKDIEHIILPQ